MMTFDEVISRSRALQDESQTNRSMLTVSVTDSKFRFRLLIYQRLLTRLISNEELQVAALLDQIITEMMEMNGC